MDQKHIKLINDNIEELINVTNRLDEILEKLEKELIFNKYMVKHIYKYEGRRRLKEFYEMIQGRGPKAFSNLLSILRGTENFRAEQILSFYKLSSYESPSNMERQLSFLSIADDTDGLDKILKVKIHPERKFMDEDKENQPGGTYRMRSKPRGHALIINIYSTLEFRDRVGSEVDVKKLNKLFSDLGYEVFLYTNLTLKQIKDKIITFSLNPKLAVVDSTVVFIMSHGRQPKLNDRSVDLIMSDGNVLNTNWITERFMRKYSKLNSDVIDRKPKLFFFQACRSAINTVKLNIHWSNSNTETDSVLVSAPSTRRNFEDTFQVFSTITGYPSMRDKVHGAWFVNKFCEVVAENSWRYDLDTMLGMVDEGLREMNSEQYGYQTCEVLKQGVSKKVFFNPGL